MISIRPAFVAGLPFYFLRCSERRGVVQLLKPASLHHQYPIQTRARSSPVTAARSSHLSVAATARRATSQACTLHQGTPVATMAPPSDLPTYSFSSAGDFETFLERESSDAAGIYLKLAKKSSGIASISAAEAVEVALCFGWIDGRANAVDADWWTVRYTPRRPKSIWSQKNVATISRLTEQGRMRPGGLAAVESAKADGRWERAYAGPATISVPDDFAAAVAANATAAAFFQNMNKSDRYAVLWRIETASPQARAKRIEALVQTLSAGKRPGAAERPVAKSKEKTIIQKTTKRAAGLKKKGPVGRKAGGAAPVQDEEVATPRRGGLRSRK